MSKMSYMIAIVCLFIGLFVSVPNNVLATERWIVMGSTVWTAEGNQLTLDFPDSSPNDLRVRSSTTGPKYIKTSPQIPLGSTIKQVALCYKTPNSGSTINNLRLSEYIITTATVLEDFPSVPESSTATCYISPVFQASPQGALYVKLWLNFANVSDSISIGGLGLLVEE